MQLCFKISNNKQVNYIYQYPFYGNEGTGEMCLFDSFHGYVVLFLNSFFLHSELEIRTVARHTRQHFNVFGEGGCILAIITINYEPFLPYVHWVFQNKPPFHQMKHKIPPPPQPNKLII